MPNEKGDSNNITIEDLAEMGREDLDAKKEEIIPKKDNNTVEKTGVDLFLEANEYNPLLIPFGKNEETGDPITKNFHELEADVQKNILQSFTKERGVKLSESEESDLAVLRDKGVSLEEFANKIAEEKVNEYVLSDRDKNEQEKDINKMSNKDLFTFFMKSSNGDISDDDISDKFELLEESGKVESKISNIKEILEEEKNELAKKARKVLNDKLDEVIETERGFIADAAVETETIGGWKVSPEQMEDTLDRIMETVTDKKGNKMSRFQHEVMGDPKQMIKAEWYLKHGDLYFKRMEKHYKEKMDEMFLAGKNSVLKGDIIEDKEDFFKKETENKGEEKKYKTPDDLFD